MEVDLDDLHDRLAYTLSAATVLCTDGSLAFHQGRAGYVRRFAETLEEYLYRGICPSPASVLLSCRLPPVTSPASPIGAERVVRGDLPKEFLVKYGHYPHLLDLLERGSIRIAPATTYLDPSLNAAISDNELEFETVATGVQARLRRFDRATGQLGDLIPIEGPIKLRNRTKGDYYVSCLSDSFDIRMFYDFECASCLIIHNRDEFIKRLRLAFIRHVGCWKAYHGPVEYADPFDDPWSHKNIIFSKHMRYGYQNEFRIAWTPIDCRTRLNPIFLKLGSLNDIAILYCADQVSVSGSSCEKQLQFVAEKIRLGMTTLSNECELNAEVA